MNENLFWVVNLKEFVEFFFMVGNWNSSIAILLIVKAVVYLSFFSFGALTFSLHLLESDFKLH